MQPSSQRAHGSGPAHPDTGGVSGGDHWWGLQVSGDFDSREEVLEGDARVQMQQLVEENKLFQ